MKSYVLRKAERTLRRGMPLDLTQVMALAEEGIDADVVESRITGKEDHTYNEFN